MADMLTILMEVMEDELKRQVFLYIPSDRTWLYQEPEKWWEGLDAFPSARHDAVEASRCYALAAIQPASFTAWAFSRVAFTQWR